MKHLLAGTCVAAMLVATGCTEDGSASRNVLGGAAIGSAAGALGGLLVGGDDRRNALVGAGIGLLVGAGVGTYLDRQEQDLRESMADTGATVTRENDRLLVSLPDGITFDTDSVALKPESRRAINELAQSLNEYPSSYIDVIGHTDSTGADDYNQRLSERRAQAVASALVRRNVNAARIESAGMGETDPIASNDTPSGRARNRRVEVYIIPATK
ncbi:OmpA family protein [Oceanicella sp. SM1341]|uniref:OmpA family protein n=1 Tax=Oceanicella sp. SM1341 TaxID=1548889 RepID=UPI000E4A6D45|nr:OmpA family protein [Oceanicella sp. SM1341]